MITEKFIYLGDGLGRGQEESLSRYFLFLWLQFLMEPQKQFILRDKRNVSISESKVKIFVKNFSKK